MDASLIAASDTTYWLTFLAVFALGYVAGCIRDRRFMRRHWRMQAAMEKRLIEWTGHVHWYDDAGECPKCRLAAEAREALEEK